MGSPARLTRDKIKALLLKYGEGLYVGGGGAMTLRGLRDDTRDLDVEAPPKAFEKLRRSHGSPARKTSPMGDPMFTIPGTPVDVFAADALPAGDFEPVGDAPGMVATEPALLKFYKALNRPKDQAWIKLLQSRAALNKAAAFAPGIRNRNTEGSLTALRPGDLATYIRHMHDSHRAKLHTDVRIGSPSTGLLSWATKKDIPTPGDRPIRLFRQPIHTWQYGSFQGNIKSGYGKGKVWLGGKNEILVTKAQPDKLNFTIADERGQERFSLFQTKDGGWLLSNVTPRAPGMLEGNGKVKYTSVDPEEAEKLIEGGHATSAKLDGASLVASLGDKIEAVSYRTRKDKNTLIPYTERLGLYKHEVPPEIKGEVIKGELIGERDGTILPPQELSGLLNMNLGPMLRKNKETGTRLKVALYAVAGAKNPKETAERLKAITARLPKDIFTVAETEQDPVKGMELYKKIKSGMHPMTSEGVVLTPPEGGTPIKSKFLKEDDVVIRNVFPAETQAGSKAGGFEYSHPGSDEVVGRVGSGFDRSTAEDMLNDPAKYIGRTARVKHQGRFDSGALRGPSYLGLNEDK